ncbi:exodeoxyribonuclease V subunit beta [Niveibacterium terrae]|uniref:exodeoxyribonuclease V subunit beta n=1 Tax=Niveibacterium terrae TaxID=3373598 RepID=UPI003A93DCFC
MSPTRVKPEALAPLSFPLHGSRLIEASAGTGKTWTIAALYLRLVLGHGGDAAFTRELVPPEILVVTFTDAATKELRDRIRARLSEAANAFYAGPQEPSGDALLEDLRAGYPIEAWAGCARTLQRAAEWMDEAAVSTIHSWCNRMLREHAFDSGSLFTQRLETDLDDLLAEVVRDYWRSFVYPLDSDAARQLGKWWSSPEELQAAVRSLFAHAELFSEALDPQHAFARADAEKRQCLEALKAPWRIWVDELQDLFDAAREAKEINGTKLKKNNYDAWLAAIAAWRDDAALDALALSESAWKRLSPDGILDAWKTEPPGHPAFAALASLKLALQALPNARDELLRHATRWISERFAAEKARRAQMGFDDLLLRLASALSGPNGARLAEAIRAQFPVALIDEFQDTDSIQYRIFDTVYRVASNDPATALILIGDPKQAIYSFRGADIHTYLVARAACQDRLYTLDCNYRSSAAMVAATNALFNLAEARESGEGAFLFRTPDEDPLPFNAIRAAGRRDFLEVDGAVAPALSLCTLAAKDEGKPPSKDEYTATMAAVCASEMVRLLNLGALGRAGFREGDAFRPLRPADLAVLVNNRGEAEAIRRELARRALRSVYLSDQDSVYQRPEAVDLQFLLAACAEPDEGRALRAALATATLALDWQSLDRLKRDELAWDERVMQFRRYRDCWRSLGVLPMLRRLLNDFGVPARLLATEGGERRLTDILHLAELLQQASVQLDGEHALIRHLAEQRSEDARSDSRQVRLESDAELIKIVTIHKSKGLEYPLVFLPFACNFRAVKSEDLPLKWHDGAGRLQVALADTGGVCALADRERLGEDLRKLYVALTRARHASWIGLARVAAVERSAIGHLFGGSLDGGIAELGDRLASLALMEPTLSDERVALAGVDARVGEARRSLRRVQEAWWVASYSALHRRAEASETAAEDVFREAARAAPSEQSGPALPVAGTLHAFPRGAAVGTFLHDLLEWCANQGFARIAARRDLLRDTIARRCAVRAWEGWIDVLTDWTLAFLVRKIDAAGFALADLANWSAELEFWLAVHDQDLSELDRIVCRATLGGEARPRLLPGQLNGMLKGFIDLVAEHEGRYYVIDYKSNWLGPDDQAYSPDAMRKLILAERYELQYVLYLLALHRLLKLRLPDYDYDRHIGGAVYLLLRGAGAAHFEKPPRSLIEELDRLFAKPHRQEAA